MLKKNLVSHFLLGGFRDGLLGCKLFLHIHDALRILVECLLTSSLPGKVLRKHVDIVRLAEQFNMHSQSQAW